MTSGEEARLRPMLRSERKRYVVEPPEKKERQGRGERQTPRFLKASVKKFIARATAI